MKKYPGKLLLLDLDNTLWDFDANAEEALTELFHRHHLHLRSGFQVHQFVDLYQKVNKQFWKQYENGDIGKDYLRTARFTETFMQMGIPAHEHPENAWEEYLEICPIMTRLVPGALELLQALFPLTEIGLLTNGFDKTQNLKISHSGIDKYIGFMVTSESAGIPKPSKEIFDIALQKGHAKAADTLYCGDTWDTDVAGGVLAGISTVWFNRLNAEIPADLYATSPYFAGSVNNHGQLLEHVILWLGK